MLPILAQQLTEQTNSWLPVLILLMIGIGFGVANVLISILVGPSRTGPGKETTYESGMMPVGDTRRRFNVKFYLVAITFVVFDVEVVFLYPWATSFPHAVVAGSGVATVLLVSMLVFIGVILVGYLYEWGKGVFRWD
jgi:NADH-quinone oxidoreductase subunit A